MSRPVPATRGAARTPSKSSPAGHACRPAQVGPSGAFRVVAAGLSLLLAIGGGVLAPGCASSGSRGEAAAGSPGRMILMVEGPLQDTDGNGYLDTVVTRVYLMGYEGRAFLPQWVEGTFRFELKTEGGEPIQTWTVGPEAAVANRVRVQDDPCYSMGLRLVEGADVRERETASLSATFESVTGRQVRTSALTVFLGPAGSWTTP